MGRHRRRGGRTGLLGTAAALALTTFGAAICDVALFPGQVSLSAPPAAPASEPPPRRDTGTRPLPIWIQVPAIGVRARIIPRGLRADGTLDVPPLSRVHEAGWYRVGPSPGEPGPSVIAGHVDSTTEPGVFHRLRELRPGDDVRIVRDDGETVTFRVERLERVAQDRFPIDRVYERTDRPVLRLITCGGALDEDRGGYEENVIAYASLSP